MFLQRSMAALLDSTRELHTFHRYDRLQIEGDTSVVRNQWTDAPCEDIDRRRTICQFSELGQALFLRFSTRDGCCVD